MADTLGDQQLFDSIKNHLQHFVALNEERREVVLEAANLLSSLKKRKVNEDSEESLRKLVDCYAKIAKSATDEFSTVSTVSQNLIEAIISKQAGAVPTNSRTNSLPASPTRNFELEVRSPEIPDAIASDENEEQSEAVIDEVLDQDDEEDSGQGSSSFTGMVFTKKRSIPKSNNIWNISERENPLSQGYEVAALVDEHSDPNLWILAKVLKYDVVRDRYRVLDADTADGQNKHYTLIKEKIVALPSPEEIPIAKRTEFLPNDLVLAIYPKTTVFYLARVEKGPKQLKSSQYALEFKDDHGVITKVDARHVFPLPDRYYENDELILPI